MTTDATAQATPRWRTSILRAAIAFAVITAAFANFTPALVQDWEHSPATPSGASPAAETALNAARAINERIGLVEWLEQSVFPKMVDEAQRLARTDPVFDAKFDVREMTLRLCKKHEEELLTDTAKIVAAHYTIDEMRYPTAFFGSRTGARFLQLSNTLAANKGDAICFGVLNRLLVLAMATRQANFRAERFICRDDLRRAAGHASERRRHLPRA